jgi:hypothetical protein
VTVREDYSDDGDAWNYCTPDHARSRVCRWGEDGLGGISEADAFYASTTPLAVRDDSDRASIMRQALAGMLWTR